MLTILLIIALLIAIVAVIFALQNTALVVVSFFAWQFEQSLALVLLFTVIVGVIIGILTVLPGALRSKWRVSSQRKKIDNLEKKLQEASVKRDELERQVIALQNPSSLPEPPAVVQESASLLGPQPSGQPQEPKV